ncbi:MAG: primosomal protein N' [Opitutaceae bacterium]|jgi:primosomal protein N' (replication factor Y)|nr:primosomal protein N' [Opitutaceae bacterium]
MIVGVQTLAGFEKTLHYRVPERLAPLAQTGSLVRVPLLNRTRLGVIASIGAPADFPVSRLKHVLEVVHPFPAMPGDLPELARWMSAYYAAPIDTVIEAMLPASVRKGARLKTERTLRAGRPFLQGELERLEKRAPAQARLAAFLARQLVPQKKSLVLARLGVSAAAADALVEKGLAVEEERRVERTAYADALADGELVAAQPHVLNEGQRAAVEAIRRRLAAGGFGVTLLHGVTGSGKTEVYLRAIQETLERGGGVIFLVPEVALTPQTVGRLRARLEAIAPGHRCVVWHSHLGEGERLDGWRALASGEAKIVVGARSAVFAPVSDLRLVVVDEEHEPAYKQDETPRYNGRDVAVMRAKLRGALCVLGSATPSMESHANALAGKYALVELRERIDNRRLPLIHVVDMRVEAARQRTLPVLSGDLARAMRERFEKKEQTILFINRRGYSSSMLCRKCGHTEECPHCSLKMTYHRTDETLRCHLCGHQRGAPLRCPKCGSPEIRWPGLGTQRVEEAAARLLRDARVERIDTDAMARKNRLRELLAEFRAGKIDVLVGTQMIAKGLDFPNVTLVGLVDADISMHVPDFRARERTFQLLVQVAGRAGRGDRAGEVVVQTFTPSEEVIQFSRHADFAGFAASELEWRRRFGYPPQRHLILHAFRGKNPDKLAFFAEQWARLVERELAGRVELRGPVEAPIAKIEDTYRWQLWYFTNTVTRAVAELNALRARFQWPDDVIQTLDVDAMSLG